MRVARRFKSSTVAGGGMIAMLGLLALLVILAACESSDTPSASPVTPVEVVPVANEPPEPEHRPEYGPAELDDGGIDAIPHDAAMAAEGERLFEVKTCGECHDMNRRRRGPPLGGVTERRTPQWLARMIMHPERMVRIDPVAKAQLSEYMCMMPDLDVTPEETLALLAYLATQPGDDAER